MNKEFHEKLYKKHEEDFPKNILDCFLLVLMVIYVLSPAIGLILALTVLVIAICTIL